MRYYMTNFNIRYVISGKILPSLYTASYPYVMAVSLAASMSGRNLLRSSRVAASDENISILTGSPANENVPSSSPKRLPFKKGN